MNYLFEEQNQGHFKTYIPFTCNKELTQEKANYFMEKHGPIVRRLGAGLQHLIQPAGDEGYIIKPFYCTYKKPYDIENVKFIFTPEMIKQAIEKNDALEYDWLPKDFEDWPIIEGISGNY